MMAGEKPILFSGPLVRAILAGEKTQTRRLPRWAVGTMDSGDYGAPLPPGLQPWAFTLDGAGPCSELRTLHHLSAHPVGTLLWVRETWTCSKACPVQRGIRETEREVTYRADAAQRWAPCPWDYAPPQTVRAGNYAPSIFMPRWASRITLRVTSVRLERLQAITDADIHAEGLEAAGWVELGESLRNAWARGWDSINGKRGKPGRPATWAENPWVVVYGFERVEAGR